MIARRDVFQAIADPTRRSILGLLSSKPMTLSHVAENFKMSQPAVSKHMRILKECGLISVIKRGREHHCTGHLNELKEVAIWLEQYKIFWNEKMDALGAFLEKSGLEEKGKNQNKLK